MFVADSSQHHGSKTWRRHEPDRPDGRTGEIAERFEGGFYLPGTVRSKGDGVWETDSVDNLKRVP